MFAAKTVHHHATSFQISKFSGYHNHHIELFFFFSLQIKTIKETSLSANQDKSAIKKMPWKVEGVSGSEPATVRGGPVDPLALVVEMGPMEIRTFILQI